MKKKKFNVEHIIQTLVHAQSIIITDAYASTDAVDHSSDDQALFAAVKKYLAAYGIGVYQPSKDTTITYRENHPDVKAILNASLEDLPEYLSSEDRVLRILAKRKLDILTEGGKGDGL